MKSNGSLNHIFRLVWSQVTNAWVAVAENTKGKSKGSRKLVAAALSLSIIALTLPDALAGPSGAQVLSGTASVQQAGNVTTVNQTSHAVSLNWNSFNIAGQETVNFNQPSKTAVAVNHILGNNGSQILGHLNANGIVYLVNPNGILFGQGAQVNVGALVASTLNLSESTLSPSSTVSFAGNGAGSIINAGSINASPGGYVALIGNTVINQGTITAPLGAVALAAGSAVTLSFDSGSLVKLQIDQSTLDNLAQNNHLIQANGGLVMMSAGTKESLLKSVVNNTGVIEALTIDDLTFHPVTGKITLLAGLVAGTTQVSGSLDASAPTGGNGGFIETSAAQVKIADAAKISTRATFGKSGNWLIDPTDFTIAASGGDISGSTLTSELANSSVTIASTSGKISGLGDIHVNAPVSWSANQLTLDAQNNIYVNANLNASNLATLALVFGSNGNLTTTGATINLPAGTGNFSTEQGLAPVKNYTVITTAAGLQNIAADTNYAIGSNIDLALAAFTPITSFSSTFEGLGHTISNVNINGGASTGLFAEIANATIQNIGLVAGTVTGNASTGALVGNMAASTINNSYAQNINVIGKAGTGGLVGTIVAGNSSISNSYTTGTVKGDAGTGGLVGSTALDGSKNINSSYATGAVDGNAGTGGLVGSAASLGNISNSYATGAVSGHAPGGAGTGGLVGSLAFAGNISNSYATGNVINTGAATGGLVGSTANSGSIINSCASGNVQGDGAGTGGLVGSSAASRDINQSYATGNVMSVAAGSGGLVGSNTSGAIYRSFASGNVNGGGAGTGGLAGSNTLGLISESFAVGNVSGTGFSIAAPNAEPTLGASTGGLVGSNSGTIRNSYATGSVIGYASGVGGLVGSGAGAEQVSTSYSSGNVVNGNGDNAVGGGTITNLGQTWRAGTIAGNPILSGIHKILALSETSFSKTYDGMAFNVMPTLAPSCCDSKMTVSFPGLSSDINAGVYTVIPILTLANAALAPYFSVAPVTLNIAQASLTVTGTTANNTVYNGTSAATLVGGILSALPAHGSLVTLSQTGAYLNPNAGWQTINVTNTLTGDNPGNYILSQTNGLAAMITPLALSVTGTTASNTVYNGTTTANVSGGTLSTLPANGTRVSLAQSGSYVSPNAGAQSINMTDILLGNELGNYTLIQPDSLTAMISPQALTVTGSTTSTTSPGGAAGATGSTVASMASSAAASTLASTNVSASLNNQTTAVSQKKTAAVATEVFIPTLGSTVIPTVVNSLVVSTPDNLVTGNYVIAYTNGTMSISLAPSTVIDTTSSKAASGTAAIAFSDTVIGLINGDAASTTTPASVTKGASNAINITLKANENYAVSFVDGQLSVQTTTIPNSGAALLASVGTSSITVTAGTANNFAATRDTKVAGSETTSPQKATATQLVAPVLTPPNVRSLKVTGTGVKLPEQLAVSL